MSDFLASAYPWFKSIHIVAVISWMAGLLYLPRLFVNHVTAGPEAAAMLTGMEERLMRIIMRPASAVTLIFGGLLLSTPGVVDWSAGWIYVKLACVLGLFAAHGLMEKWRGEFARGENRRPAKFFRIINEVPTLLMIIIVLMVVVKPF
ncbi:MAG: protoporphyrinogen oxidase HemJ [Rhodospirillaceae bacterium]|nr:protoporphyrinogen oxidase HemJ [Rhodospirillaceae bacterium]